MFNNQLLRQNIAHLITTAGIAVLIYIYGVAQGFTLPLHFESKPKAKVLSSETVANPSPKPTTTPTPHISNPSNPSHFSHPSILLNPTSAPVLPAAAAVHASEKAQEVAQVPEHAIEHTQEVLTNVINKTLEKAEEKLFK